MCGRERVRACRIAGTDREHLVDHRRILDLEHTNLGVNTGMDLNREVFVLFVLYKVNKELIVVWLEGGGQVSARGRGQQASVPNLQPPGLISLRHRPLVCCFPDGF